MKKLMYALIIIGVFVITGCDNTTTSNLLDGDFVPADTSPPSILGPEDGEVVLNLTADLRWTSKEGVSYYIIDVATDAEFASPIPDSPITVTAPTTFYGLTLPAAGRYYWRISTSETAAGQYDESYFDAREDCLYVYFPYDAANPDAKSDDTGRTGNIDAPYQNINRAMAEAAKLGISTVKVATRGEISAGNFAAYEEYFLFKDGVSLQGGWNSDFTERHDFSTGLDNNDYETKLRGKYYQPMKIEAVYTSTLIEGFVLNPVLDSVAYNTGGLIIENCGKDLIIRYCKIYSEGLGIQCASLLLKYTEAQIIFNTITSAASSSYTLYGVVNYYSDSAIIGNKIIASSVSTTGELSCRSCGIINSGNGILINNLIVAGNSSGGIGFSNSQSYGFLNDSGNPLLINNLIISGEATTVSATACSYGLYNDSGCIPLMINNIIMTIDSDGDRYGIYGSGVGDINYHYNCIYGNGGTDYTGITLGTGNVDSTIDPPLVLNFDSDYRLIAGSSPEVTGGGVIDPFSYISATFTPLDEYLLDITGAVRTPAYVQDSTDLGWSMGAYEY